MVGPTLALAVFGAVPLIAAYLADTNARPAEPRRPWRQDAVDSHFVVPCGNAMYEEVQ